MDRKTLKKLKEMKNIKIILTTLAIIVITSTALIFNSCQKDEQVKSILQTKPSASQMDTEKGKVTITMSWDGWGLKKHDCKKGHGLCRFKITIEYEETEKHTALVFSDDEGNLFANVFVDKELMLLFEGDDTSLLIEEDLYSKASDGTVYMIPAGSYPMKPEMGKLGGYIIPIIVK